MVAAAALNERDGAGNDGTLARTNTARQMGKIGNGGPATQKHQFALDTRPRGALASLPAAATPAPFRRKFNGIIRRQTGIIRNWLMTKCNSITIGFNPSPTGGLFSDLARFSLHFLQSSVSSRFIGQHSSSWVLYAPVLPRRER